MKSLYRQFVAATLFAIVAFPLRAEPIQLKPQYDPWPEADAVVEKVMEEQRIVGCAVGLIQNHKVVYLKGYGVADKRKKTLVTRKTSFRWASISKPLTALTALQLVEAGKLDLDKDIREYVPEFPDKGVTITTRQLLGHLGGIVHYQNGPVVKTERTYDVEHPFEDVILALDTFKESPLVAQPGEAYNYTTHGYILVSAIIERAGKQQYWSQVQERIAHPAGMTSFQPDYPWVDIPNRTEGYEVNDVMTLRSRNADVSWKLGGGGYTSTIDDLARFAVALMNGNLLKPDTNNMMWTRQKTTDGKETTYGLGIGVSGDADVQFLSHSGSQEKTRTNMIVSPTKGIGVVLMSNSEQTDTGSFGRALLDFVEQQDSQ